MDSRREHPEVLPSPRDDSPLVRPDPDPANHCLHLLLVLLAFGKRRRRPSHLHRGAWRPSRWSRAGAHPSRPLQATVSSVRPGSGPASRRCAVLQGDGPVLADGAPELRAPSTDEMRRRSPPAPPLTVCTVRDGAGFEPAPRVLGSVLCHELATHAGVPSSQPVRGTHPTDRCLARRGAPPARRRQRKRPPGAAPGGP